MEIKGFDVITLVDQYGMDYIEIYDRAIDILNDRTSRGYYYEIYDRSIVLKRVDAVFPSSEEDTEALRYTFEVHDNV